MKDNRNGLEIAVIGMAGRFPGADNINQFWINIRNGIESITFLDDKDLQKVGLHPNTYNNPNYVKSCGGVLKGKNYFDASFFNYTSSEAEVMDPQIRVFHECAWEALEDAGYNPYECEERIGLFAGASKDFNWESMCIHSKQRENVGNFALNFLSNRDFLTTQISYKLGLKGSSIFVQTACSTSLSAISMACWSILLGQCEMALAGGISLSSSPKQGYMYQDGMILSPDGHCRPFDDDAKGTVPGEGAGIVVLKSLEDAVNDGDNIYAIIKGFGINNDGNEKIGFSAPSTLGQSEAVKAALHMSEVSPESIAFIEAHGTGTSLGDPLELEALKMAFSTEEKQFCALGSVKSNIGHLDAAAGVAGFIKTVLSIKNREIPPSINYNKPNAKIDFNHSPFYVNTSLKKYENNHFPMRAGINSLGIGGTNIHMLLEELQFRPEEQEDEYKLLLLSAKSITSLNKATENLVEHLKTNSTINLTNVAYTLAVGRKCFEFKKMVVCSTCDNAVELLSKQNNDKTNTNFHANQDPKIIFMFPGQGSQYIQMGYDLYKNDKHFRSKIDECFHILQSKTGMDGRSMLFNADVNSKDVFMDTKFVQPLLFIFEYVMAKHLIDIGIEPYAMIGHSIGEIVAACVSGVISLEDAIMLVSFRGAAMSGLPGGAMLSVPLSEDEIRPYLTDLISLAAVNSSTNCVVSGSFSEINALKERLINIGISCINLHTSHAFHSSMMEPILGDFKIKVSEFDLHSPKIRYISNVTGSWIKDHEATNPEYWAQHIKSTVRFSSGIEELLKDDHLVFIEVGPGKVLTTLVEQQMGSRSAKNYLVNLIRHPKDKISDYNLFLTKIGELWLHGVNIDWKKFYSTHKRTRVSLPTYPFEQQSYLAEVDGMHFINKNAFLSDNLIRAEDMAKWFYVPAWEQSMVASKLITDDFKWLIFCNYDCVFSSELISRLSTIAADVNVIYNRKKTNLTHNSLYIDPNDKNGYYKLIKNVLKESKKPIKIIHLWTLENEDQKKTNLTFYDSELDNGFYSLINIAQAIGKLEIVQNIDMIILTNHLFNVLGNECVCPEKSTMLGIVKILPLEFTNVKCKCIDIGDILNKNGIYDHVINDFFDLDEENVIAYRGTHRWIQKYKSAKLQNVDTPTADRFRHNGVYLIIGGFGGMGFSIAKHLGQKYKANLVLVGRTEFPDRNEWVTWLTEHDQINETSKKINAIKMLEEDGANVMALHADISNHLEMKNIKNKVLERFGEINGIIHSGGVIDYGGVVINRTKETLEKYMDSKIKGTCVLDAVFKDMHLDFIVLFSSLGNIIYKAKFGQVGYNAANEFLESFVDYKLDSGTLVSVINWCDWKEVGMTVNANKDILEDAQGADELIFRNAITPSEGVIVFMNVVNQGLHHVSVSPIELDSYVSFINSKVVNILTGNDNKKDFELNNHMRSRPDISTKYIEASDDVEKSIAEIFQKILCIDKIGVEDDFFELGGDSLKVMNVIVFLKQNMNLKITLDMFYNNPTIMGIKKYNDTLKNKQSHDKYNDLIATTLEVSLNDGQSAEFESFMDNNISSSKVVNFNVTPFTDIYYKDCFYNAVFSSIIYFKRSIMPFLYNEIAIYDLTKDENDFKFTVEYVSEKLDHRLLKEMGIKLDMKLDSSNIIKDIKSALMKDSLAIVLIDCFYEPFRIDTYHKIHWPHAVLVHGFDDANKRLSIMEHDDVNSLMYKSLELSYENLVMCNKGYIQNFRSYNQSPIFYEISLEEKLSFVEQSVQHGNDKFIKMISNKLEYYKQGIASLILFRDIVEEIVSDENLLSKKIEKLSMTCNDVIRAKKAEFYRFTKIFEGKTDITAIINDVTNQWDILRGIFNKYKFSMKYQTSIINRVKDQLDNIYKLENEFCYKLLALCNSAV